MSLSTSRRTRVLAFPCTLHKMNDCLDPLPSDLATLTAKASHAAQLGLDTVDSIIARLEAARPRHEDGAATGSRPVADQLTALNMFVKTTNAKTATAHKDWSTAVNKFAKAVDKVRQREWRQCARHHN